MTRAALLLGTLAAGALAAPRAQVSATPPPVVILIRAATTPETERRERKLFDELGFALDGFMVMGRPASVPRFPLMPLAEQIAAVLPDARDNEALAVVWMSFPLSGQVMLHLVALGSGRTFVRTIETDKTTASEASLALMARELLGTAYLFEKPGQVPEEVAKVVEGVRATIAPAPAVAPAAVTAPEESHPLSVWVDTALGYPLAGGVGAVPVLQLGASVRVQLPAAFEVGLGLGAGVGEVSRLGTSGAGFLRLGARAQLYRPFPLRGVRLGPLAAASLDWGQFRTSTEATTLWLPGFSLGLEARSALSRGPAVGAALLLTAAPLGAELRSEAALLYRTPTLALTLSLSFGWEGL